MGRNDNTGIELQEEKFVEYLQLHGVEKRCNIKHLKEAFLAVCQVLFQLAKVLSHVLAFNLKNYNSQISGVMKP